jgi:hypothetical protein
MKHSTQCLQFYRSAELVPTRLNKNVPDKKLVKTLLKLETCSSKST